MPRTFTFTPELTYINSRSPSATYESAVTAQVQGADSAARTTRGLMFPKDLDANLIKRLKCVYRASAVINATSSDSSGGLFTIDAYACIYNSYQIKSPTWNQAAPGLLWIGGSWHAASRQINNVADGVPVTHVHQLTKVTRFASRKQGDWPAAYVMKYSYEGGDFGTTNTIYHSDNATVTANRPTLKLTLGIQPMRSRPSGMYRGFRRS